MSFLLRYPHGFIRRHLSSIERALVAAGLSWLLYSAANSLPAYPNNWTLVIVGAVFGLTLWSPSVGYLLAVAAITYPLYNLSLYLAVLFLSVALIGMRAFVYNLGATVLVLAAPWLAPYYLSLAVPVLGGIGWGATGGAVIGGLACLWGQIAAGMAGLDPDWLARLDSAPQAAGVVERFAAADSLETLMLIIEPLAPDPTVLLYYLLQIILWAVIGGLVGSLADRAWTQRRRPWGTVLFAWLGAFGLAAGHIALGLWLQLLSQQSLDLLWMPILISAVLGALLVSILIVLQDVLEHPLPQPVRQKRKHRRQDPDTYTPAPTPLPIQDDLYDQENDADDDLIMLELD